MAEAEFLEIVKVLRGLDGKYKRIEYLHEHHLDNEELTTKLNNSPWRRLLSNQDDVSEILKQYDALLRQSVGTEIVQNMHALNTVGSRVYYPFRFAELDSETDSSVYEQGYADPDFFKRTAPFKWQLKAGKNAADGLRSWLKGTTIAECGTTLVATQLKSILNLLGDKKFNDKFGAADRDSERRLVISSDLSECIPIDWIRGTSQEGFEVGAKYYFKNHPHYMIKHPEGFWQGENAVYAGKKNEEDFWVGFGAEKTTDEMKQTLLDEYNEERTEEDYQHILWNASCYDKETIENFRSEHGYKYSDMYHGWKNKTTENGEDRINPWFTFKKEAPETLDSVDEIPGVSVETGINLNTRKILGY